jgi:hypothetical protein
MSLHYALKVLLSVVVIVAVSEVSKRSSFLGGLLASLPLVSLLSFAWLYYETKDAAKIAALSWSVFWLVIPSLLLFVALPLLLKAGFRFPLALTSSIGVMLAGYGVMVGVLRFFGIQL